MKKVLLPKVRRGRRKSMLSNKYVPVSSVRKDKRIMAEIELSLKEAKMGQTISLRDLYGCQV